MIIALGGAKRSGKDTASLGLIKFHDFVRIALADKLKDIVSEVTGISRSVFDDDNLKEKPFDIPLQLNSQHIQSLLEIVERDGFIIPAETYQTVCREFYDTVVKTPRHLLQLVGTDILRTYISNDIWLIYFMRKVDGINKNVVVTDARFKNERDFLKDQGAVLVLIKRPGLVSTDNHISENELGSDEDYDVVVNNISSSTALQSDIAMWYTLRRDELTSQKKRR